MNPAAEAGPPQTVSINTEVNFNAVGSSDNVKIVSYEWDFGDEATGIGLTTTHTYTELGIYTVTLTVKDAAGNEDTDTLTITVNLQPTTISCTISPSEVTEGSSVTVTGSISPAVSGTTVTLTYKKPDDSTFTRTLTTGSDGTYSDTYTPDATGSWSVITSWEGDANYDGSSSSSKSFTVLASTPFPWWILGIVLIGGIAAIVLFGRSRKQT